MQYLFYELGSHSIKVLEVQKKFRSFYPVSYQEEKVNPDFWLNPEYDEEKKNPADFTKLMEVQLKALQSLHSRVVHDENRIFCLVPSYLYSTKIVDWPRKETNKAKNAILFNLEDSLPFAIEDVLHDISFLPHHSQMDRTNTHVLTNLLLREDFSNFISKLKAHNLDPDHFSFASTALSCQTIKNTHLQIDTVALVDIGHYYTKFCVFTEGSLTFYRCFVGGGHHLTQNISSQYQVSLQEAENAKIQNGFVLTKEIRDVDEDQKLFSQTLEEPLTEIIQTLYQNIISYKSHGSPEISKIYITGGTSRVPNLISYFEEKIHIPCAAHDPFEGLRHESLPGEFRDTMNDNLAYSIAIEQNDSKRMSNLRTKEFVKKGAVHDLDVGIIKTPFMWVCYVSILLWIYLMGSHWLINSNNEKFKPTLAKTAEKALPLESIKERSRLSRNPSILEKKLKEIITTKSSSIQKIEIDTPEHSVSQILASISNSLSTGAKLDILELSFQESQMSINFKSPNANVVEESLKTIPYISNIVLSETDGSHLISFSVSHPIKKNPPKLDSPSKSNGTPDTTQTPPPMLSPKKEEGQKK